MPQLELANFPSQIFWLIISFVVIYLVVAKIVTPNIAQIFERRKNIIVSNLKRAKEIKLELESMDKRYQDDINNAKEQASKLVENAKNSIKKQTEIELLNLNQKLSEHLHKAEKEIEKLKNRKDIEELAQNIANSISDNLSKYNA